jgi:hypothetical protein
MVKERDIFLEEEYSLPQEINDATSGLANEYKNQI